MTTTLINAATVPYPVFLFVYDLDGNNNGTDIYCTVTNINTSDTLQKHCFNDLNYSLCQFNLGNEEEFPNVYTDEDVVTINCSQSANVFVQEGFNVNFTKGQEYLNTSLSNYTLLLSNASFNRPTSKLNVTWTLTNETNIDKIYFKISENYADNFSPIYDTYNSDVRTALINVSGNTKFYEICINFTNGYEYCYTDQFGSWQNTTLSSNGDSPYNILNNFIDVTYTSLTSHSYCEIDSNLRTITKYLNGTSSSVLCSVKSYFDPFSFYNGLSNWALIYPSTTAQFTNAGITIEGINVSLDAGFTTLGYTTTTQNQTQNDFCAGISGGGTNTIYRFRNGTYTDEYICGIDVPTFNLSIDEGITIENTQPITLMI